MLYKHRAMRQELGVVGVGSVERVKALWRLLARKIQTETFFRAGVEDVVKNRHRFRKGLWDEDVKHTAAALTIALKREEAGEEWEASWRLSLGFFVHHSFMDKTQDGTLPLDKSDSRTKKTHRFETRERYSNAWSFATEMFNHAADRVNTNLVDTAGLNVDQAV